MEESGVKSKSTKEVNKLNIYHTVTYVTLLGSWADSEQWPIHRIGIRYLVVEESGVESESARKSLSPYGWATP